jgi:murein DD-endopeptidase MepM/ murein hydrolase activator NlpD
VTRGPAPTRLAAGALALAAACAFSCAILPKPAAPPSEDAITAAAPGTEASSGEAARPAGPSVAGAATSVPGQEGRTDGVVHTMQPGQTLWRVAWVYGIPLDELARVNGISDPDTVEVGRKIFIPGATASLEVPPYPAPLPPPDLSHWKPSAVDAQFAWPVPGGRVLSYFGARRRSHLHAGLDIQGGRGQEILASKEGVVRAATTTRGYGKVIFLDHGNGLESVYAHNEALLVRVGDRVDAGQPIAKLGRTGNATTPHCHFEIRRDKVAVDPLPYFSHLAEVRR